MIAGAMEALLPAVDANDEEKSLECFRFFCNVLSSLPTIQVRSLAGCSMTLLQLQHAWVGWRLQVSTYLPLIENKYLQEK